MHAWLVPGALAVWPAHGIVELVERAQRRVLGPPGTPLPQEEWTEHEVYVFRLRGADRAERVLPFWRAPEVGLRRLVSRDAAEKLLRGVKGSTPAGRRPWSAARRPELLGVGKRHDPGEMLRVCRELAEARRDGELHEEEIMYADMFFERLVAEIACAMEEEEARVRERLTEIVRPSGQHL